MSYCLINIFFGIVNIAPIRDPEYIRIIVDIGYKNYFRETDLIFLIKIPIIRTKRLQ